MNCPIRFKAAVLTIWRINLFQPYVCAPIPPHIWRRLGAA
jgi:hypothetical protein